VRVLLWELGNTGVCGVSAFHSIAAKLARWKWNEARQLQQVMKHARNAANSDNSEALPDHLMALLEQDCDDVFNETLSQRAYNLTFNLSTTHNVVGVSDGMDSVVEDFAIRSPLDAVSAWYSSIVLQRALASSLDDSSALQDKTGKSYKRMVDDIELAVKTAPIGSGTQARALVARAVLVNESRGLNIAASINVVSLSKKDDPVPVLTLINTTTSIASLPDIRMSLQCAIAIAQLQRSGPLPPAVYTLINAVRPSRLSLLGFAAAFKLMQTLLTHDEASVTCARTLENLAGSLRIWIGNEGLNGGAGLPKKTKEMVVERCLGITKQLVGLGLDKDAGYESMEIEEEEGNEC
jgi:hypothetical protein